MGLIRYVCTHTWIPLWMLKLTHYFYRIYSRLSIRRNIKAINNLYDNVSRETNGGDGADD